MKVFKFGGASVSTAERIKGVANILRQHNHEKVLVVISAMGKTTNALEAVVKAFFNRKKETALQLFETIKQQHLQTLEELLPGQLHSGLLADVCTEAEWLLHDVPVRSFDYYYDQIVCVGELLSTTLVSHYLNAVEVSNLWLDVRDILRTDDNFRDARVDWNVTTEKVNNILLPALERKNIIITQGFIGATYENESTTLGREGSDYSAAIFANLLAAESLTIWKDVQGVMNADPKTYKAATWIEWLNYAEVIEMAYYGAQVIHPKTIKPLQNKNIPLYVRSFVSPALQGTCIHNQPLAQLPPIIVVKKSQVLVTFKSKDFSFVGEGLTAEIFTLFETLRFKPNLTQNTAISILCVVDQVPEKIEALTKKAAAMFDVEITGDLSLLTVRHYNNEIVAELLSNRNIVLKQQTPETLQVLTEQ